jgi:predicted RNase H-like nuclease (RuvC/YqgF family)
LGRKDSGFSSATDAPEHQRQIREKDEQIRNLNNQLGEKDEQIQQMINELKK